MTITEKVTLVKITEKVERECCDQVKDLRPYKGCMDKEVERFRPMFCIHCGQPWVSDKEMGPAGSYDGVLKKTRLRMDAW